MKGSKRTEKKRRRHSCEKDKRPKRLPYGAKSVSGISWCDLCDADLLPNYLQRSAKSIKKRERQRAKKDIKRNLNEET